MDLCHVRILKRIPISKEKLWQFFEENPNWHPDVAKPEIEKDIRKVYLKHGTTIIEKSTLDQGFTYEYHFLESLLKNILPVFDFFL